MTRFVPSSGIKQSWLRVLPPAPTNDNSGVVEVGRAEVHVQRTLYPLRFGLWLKKIYIRKLLAYPAGLLVLSSLQNAYVRILIAFWAGVVLWLFFCVLFFKAVHEATRGRFPKLIAVKFVLQFFCVQSRLFELKQLLLKLHIRQLRIHNLLHKFRDKRLKLFTVWELRSLRKGFKLLNNVEGGAGMSKALAESIGVACQHLDDVDHDTLLNLFLGKSCKPRQGSRISTSRKAGGG
ncbi:hypothetical protein TRICHSKD4_3224 [Roseibium sp. TrichSKD4]|nr:hypothetical protein TRICHSKD4_3224 [Roseibium sp. TrichSKD4]